MGIKSYRDLEVWQKSIELFGEVYTITKDFPKEEQYGLTNQIRRSAVSISSNIAEGKTRQYTNEYIQFLFVSLGSCAELETQIIISQKLGYLSEETKNIFIEKIYHISRMLRNLIKELRK